MSLKKYLNFHNKGHANFLLDFQIFTNFVDTIMPFLDTKFSESCWCLGTLLSFTFWYYIWQPY